MNEWASPFRHASQEPVGGQLFSLSKWKTTDGENTQHTGRPSVSTCLDRLIVLWAVTSREKLSFPRTGALVAGSKPFSFNHSTDLFSKKHRIPRNGRQHCIWRPCVKILPSRMRALPKNMRLKIKQKLNVELHYVSWSETLKEYFFPWNK